MIVAATGALAVTLTATAVTMPTAHAAEPGPASGRQLLFFNHAYGVLDRPTADAIEHSTYLKTFANFHVRTTTGEQGTWTGRYLMGRETYLELFAVGDVPEPNGQLGGGGLGVSVERSGELATVTQRLKDAGIEKPIEFAQKRDFGDGKPVPWFDAVFTSPTYDAFDAWAMEYRPEYFADPRSKSEPPSYPGDVGRERYLTDDYSKHLMRDVTAMRAAVTESDLSHMVPVLKVGGFVVQSRPDGGVIAIRGGTTIQFDVVSHDRIGLRSVDMSLNRPVASRHTEKLGASTLVVGPGKKATWTFPATQAPPASKAPHGPSGI